MEKLTALLEQYEGVIYNELKKMGIYKKFQDFDDYYQLGCIKLFDAFITCEVDALKEEHRYQFVKYAGQRLRWAFLDQKRRDRNLLNHEDQEDDFQMLLTQPFEENVAFMDVFMALMNQLTPKEKLFIQDRFIGGLNMSEIATKRGVSRKTVHMWRKGIQEKAQFLKNG
ncbi:sigma-70 family RNA polymerase sigma factor [Jeotgalibaca sp. A127]|uniref:sigma-70 family RNA polymerase sigma factor n=1 Tax=Jeotgalibaca sp. A127 TaxID=3457324 RepID=UPI003FD6AEDC